MTLLAQNPLKYLRKLYFFVSSLTFNSKKIYLNILGLKHTIIIGESGSGKSVFIQNILLSIFKNLNLIFFKTDLFI